MTYEVPRVWAWCEGFRKQLYQATGTQWSATFLVAENFKLPPSDYFYKQNLADCENNEKYLGRPSRLVSWYLDQTHSLNWSMNLAVVCSLLLSTDGAWQQRREKCRDSHHFGNFLVKPSFPASLLWIPALTTVADESLRHFRCSVLIGQLC